MKHIQKINIFLKGEESRARTFEDDVKNGVSIKVGVIDDFFVVNEIHQLDGDGAVEKRVQAWPVKDVVSYNMVILGDGKKVEDNATPLLVVFAIFFACGLGFLLGLASGGAL